MNKKQILFVLIAFVGLNCYSQIAFEKGYYIDESNEKIACLIKNIEWKNNPTQFDYKLSEEAEKKTATIKTVKEFGINDVVKYCRKTVEIDRSSENVNKLSIYKNPVFEEEQLFLKVLVEGKATLYQYNDSNLKRYFYDKENATTEQLIFKSYKTPENNVGTNNEFKEQLRNNLKCETMKVSRFYRLNYIKNDLVKLFVDYNTCIDPAFTFEKKQRKDVFNLSIKPRLNNNSLTVQNSISETKDTEFDAKLGFGLGLEAEYILPFNKNKWAVLIEPTYQSFKDKKTTETGNVSGGQLITNVAYSSIELPIGIRHYFFLNDKSKIFLDVFYVFDFSSNSLIDFNRNDGTVFDLLDIQSRPNWAMGVGYKYTRFSLELRHQTNREILGSYINWISDYKTLSVILGVELF